MPQAMAFCAAARFLYSPATVAAAMALPSAQHVHCSLHQLAGLNIGMRLHDEVGFVGDAT